MSTIMTDRELLEHVLKLLLNSLGDPRMETRYELANLIEDHLKLRFDWTSIEDHWYCVTDVGKLSIWPGSGGVNFWGAIGSGASVKGMTVAIVKGKLEAKVRAKLAKK
jgi:hypothetical protein